MNDGERRAGSLGRAPQAAADVEALYRLKDNIYKRVTDIYTILKKGEDEAQVEMLKWENFVI